MKRLETFFLLFIGISCFSLGGVYGYNSPVPSFSVPPPNILATEIDTIANWQEARIIPFLRKHNLSLDQDPSNFPESAKKEYEILNTEYENKVAPYVKRFHKRLKGYPHLASSLEAALNHRGERRRERITEALKK